MLLPKTRSITFDTPSNQWNKISLHTLLMQSRSWSHATLPSCASFYDSATSLDALSLVLRVLRRLSTLSFQKDSPRDFCCLDDKQLIPLRTIQRKTYFFSHTSIVILWRTLYTRLRRVKRAGRLHPVSSSAWLDKTTNWLLLALINKSKTSPQ